jgi:two-component system, cell cycle sensor histidine kinase and response regulator CckA
MKEVPPVGNGELVLIVDDEPVMREIATQVLETHGYRVIQAGNGAEGVAVFSRHVDEIKLVISDMEMPVMNGAAMIRSIERINPDIRVISSTGIAAGKDAANCSTNEHGTASPHHRILNKPYRLVDLLRTVDEALKAA